VIVFAPNAAVAVVVAAVDVARDRIAGKSTQNRTTRNAGNIAMGDGAADNAAADGTDNRARRMAVTAAGIGRRSGDAHPGHNASCNRQFNHRSQHKSLPYSTNVRPEELTFAGLSVRKTMKRF
jgi:hypothetical protein